MSDPRDIFGRVEGCRQFLRGKAKRFVDKLRRVTSIPRQSALLLTRSCIAPSLLHLLRTIDSTDLEDIWSEANHALIRSVQQFASVGAEPDLDQTAHCLATLPLKFGGLCLPNYADLIPHSAGLLGSSATKSLTISSPSMSVPRTLTVNLCLPAQSK